MHQNLFSSRAEILLIDYEDIIKSKSLQLLTILSHNEDLLNTFKDILNVDKIKNKSIEQLKMLNMCRDKKNIFEYLMLDEGYDYQLLLNALCSNIKTNLYFEAENLVGYDILTRIINESFINKIYIRTKQKDAYILEDICLSFNKKMKFSYCFGDIVDVVDNIAEKATAPTSYILSDIEDVQALAQTKHIEFTEVMLAEYGYNFKLDDNLNLALKYDYTDLSKEKFFKIATFRPC